MKFKADFKDIMIFLGFSLGSLYLVAIGLLNLSSLANEGVAHGFNLFPSF